MEPGIREFFRRIVTTISLLILWMMINVTIGIKYNAAFFETKVHWYNIAFYIWLVISLVALIWLCLKTWQKPIEDLHD
jgi:hypothetical protein